MKKVDVSLHCGCEIELVEHPQAPGALTARLSHCPLHRGASELLGMCKLLADYWEEEHPESLVLIRARDIIDRAEGKPGKEAVK